MEILTLIKANWRIGLLVAAFLAGWIVNGWRWNTRLAELKQGYAEAIAKTSSDAVEKQELMAAQVSAIDQKHTKELSHAKKDVERLNARVNAGTTSLRVNASCGAEIGQTATSTGLGHGPAPRLTDAAQRDYFLLRERILTVTAMLSACQEIVRADRE